MREAERSCDPPDESWAGLALIPILATVGYYALPSPLQAHAAVQFLPQLLAYVSLALWAWHNTGIARRLGLVRSQLTQGLQWGVPVGILLGTVNTIVILYAVPWLGGDTEFLRGTPHARAPLWLMLPWAITFIAVAVELNFRGFLLGRLQTLSHRRFGDYPRLGTASAILLSALVFSFDPFMLATFQHLHWIAVWDGLVWGMIWAWLRNLYATIVAHAIEVIVMYSALKLIL